MYERGIELFHFPVAFEIWNIYLSKFVRRYGGKKLERARDLFEQALENCPAKFCKPLYLMYAKLEEGHGLAKRAMGTYDRAASTVQDSDKFEMFTIYIAKATANFGLPATRPIYERAIEVLPDTQTAEMCKRFAAMERKLGEIDRARAIYAHASQFCDPRIEPEFWAEWNSFESESRKFDPADKQSTLDPRTPSERCCGSSGRCKLLSIPRHRSSPLKLLLRGKGRRDRRIPPTRWLEMPQIRWLRWRGRLSVGGQEDPLSSRRRSRTRMLRRMEPGWRWMVVRRTRMLFRWMRMSSSMHEPHQALRYFYPWSC